jgi:hypothetical protein
MIFEMKLFLQLFTFLWFIFPFIAVGDETIVFTQASAQAQEVDQLLFDQESGRWVLSPLSSLNSPRAAIFELKELDESRGVIELGELVSLSSSFSVSEVSSLYSLVQSTQWFDSANAFFLDSSKEVIVMHPWMSKFVLIKDVGQLNRKNDRRKSISGDGYRWNECYSSMTANYYESGDRECHQSRLISRQFYSFMQRHLLSCVEDASRSVGIRDWITSIHLTHTGINGDSRHQEAGGSLHNIQRAIDIKTIYAYRSDGSGYMFNYETAVQEPRSYHGQFYNRLRRCWQDAHLRRDRSCSVNKKENGYVASIGAEDRFHQKHLHLSYPFCGTNTLGFYPL